MIALFMYIMLRMLVIYALYASTETLDVRKRVQIRIFLTCLLGTPFRNICQYHFHLDKERKKEKRKKKKKKKEKEKKRKE